MTTQTQVTPLAIEDYEAIESAVMETTRGRWFLAEYARRNRNTDTDAVLATLDRIERTMRRDRAIPDIDRIRLDLADMAQAISRTKQEIAQMKLETEHGGRFADASHELDAIVTQTETATNEILLAAESIQETAWTLREAGAAEDLCALLDTHSTDIYTACSFQDLTGQRTRKVVTVLRYLESRINAMMSIWGLEEVEDLAAAAAPTGDVTDDQRPDAHLLNGPQLHGRGIQQGDVDNLMWSAPGEGEAIEITAEEPPVFDRGDVFDDADAGLTADEFEAVRADSTADVFAPAEPAPAPVVVDEEIDLSAADVFSSEATDRLAAAVRDRRVEAEDVEEVQPTFTTVTVGNTVMTVAAGAEIAAEAAPVLAVVENQDPIAALSPAGRIVAFG